ncbi:hypothetical protein [Vibrio sp. 10N.261.55.A7]|uniref:hypothetical protein n=1 Tax=Vibrio sp. 10N.261.55.A7 TaxID=1880851 RepID=UPI000C838D5C|nr:hypothetical protein [Vibrio sp. 10N.261.55.A7]PMK05219.1 hypothetical protein BCU12_00095 [Vibrio sp. 10N.261.55.A7]
MRFTILLAATFACATVNAQPFVNAQIGVGSTKANKVSMGYTIDKHALAIGYMASDGKSDISYLQGSPTTTQRDEAEAEFVTLDYSYTFANYDGFDIFVNAGVGLGKSDITRTITDSGSNNSSTSTSDHSSTYYGLHLGLSRTFESIDGLGFYALVGVDSYDYDTFDSSGLSGNLGVRYTF